MKNIAIYSFVSLLFGGFFLYLVTSFSFSVPSQHIGLTKVKETQKPLVVEQDFKILFTGDLLLARGVEWKINDYGSTYPFLNMQTLFDQHNYIVANFESAIPKEHVPTPGMTFQFSTNAKLVPELAELGITHVSQANNHALDYGQAGWLYAREQFIENGINPFGRAYTLATSSVTFIKSETKSIALVGIDLTLAVFTQDEIAAVFDYAKQYSHMQVVFVHWGVEYEHTHSQQQQTYAELFVEHGADLVIGHHPHVVQDIELVNGVPVFYSLGNFVFDQYFRDDVQQGVLLSFDLVTNEISLIPVSSIGSASQPKVMAQYERDLFLQKLAVRSNEELNTAITKGIIAF